MRLSWLVFCDLADEIGLRLYLLLLPRILRRSIMSLAETLRVGFSSGLQVTPHNMLLNVPILLAL